MDRILALDAGTTNQKAMLINKDGAITSIEQKPVNPIYPQHARVEQNAIKMRDTHFDVIKQLLTKSGTFPQNIKAIGITNQRESTIIWEKDTGKPIWNAILWNDRRDVDCFAEVKKKHEKLVIEKTGLFIETYFSACKIDWILNEVEGARERAENGELMFGTVNTWLLWCLTKGEVFATDVSNASRTLLFNINTLEWDDELLELFNVPKAILPEVVSNSEVYGKTNVDFLPTPIPIASMIGDQQGAMFGNACFDIGDVKCTYGTGAFVLMNTGSKPVPSKHKLLSTVAWKIGDNPCEYALEGLVYSAGSVVTWLKDMLGIIKTAKEIEALAFSVPDTGGLLFVPALSGLASPFWNSSVTGTIFGIKPSTNIGNFARAALEGIALQVSDVIDVMKKDSGTPVKQIKCGGKMSEDVFLLQIQTDFLGVNLVKSNEVEMTALGAGFLAGLAVGFWKDQDEIKALWKCGRKFAPEMKKSSVSQIKKQWKSAIKLAIAWADEIK